MTASITFVFYCTGMSISVVEWIVLCTLYLLGSDDLIGSGSSSGSGFSSGKLYCIQSVHKFLYAPELLSTHIYNICAQHTHTHLLHHLHLGFIRRWLCQYYGVSHLQWVYNIWSTVFEHHHFRWWCDGIINIHVTKESISGSAQDSWT